VIEQGDDITDVGADGVLGQTAFQSEVSLEVVDSRCESDRQRGPRAK
jgi:hypothetical protein